MEKITKKDIKAIRGGNHAKLMECLDFLLDSYEEDKYDLGYGACLADMSVRAHNLAGYIIKNTTIGGKPVVPEDHEQFAQEQLSRLIDIYFNEALNK